jgi:hypothetical protein
VLLDIAERGRSLGIILIGAKVIVITGNHDHAATLDAYRPFAGAAGITLVGAVRNAEQGGVIEFVARTGDIPTTAGTYQVSLTEFRPHTGSIQALSLALQARLGATEIDTALTARAALNGHGLPDGGDLLVIDGPLRGRQHLPRVLGYIKTHRNEYLLLHLRRQVASLPPGQRTPVVSEKRDLAATRRFVTRALEHSTRPTEVTTDRAPTNPRVLDEVLPAACHITEQHANNLKLIRLPRKGTRAL